LHTWLESNQTTNWNQGLRLVQLLKNRAYHQGVKCSPQETMFGSPIKFGLKLQIFPRSYYEFQSKILQNINKNNGGDDNDINTENVEMVETSQNNNDSNSIANQ
jgi:hypothetical protein